MWFERPSLSSVPSLRVGALALAGLVAMACSDDKALDSLAGPELSTATVTEQSADQFEAPAGTLTDPWGTATIKRRSDGIQIQLRVTDADVHAALAGNAITIWVASFHDPGACVQQPGELLPCGSDDFGNPDVGGFLQRAGGQVLGDGPINLAVNVTEGDDSNRQAGTAPGLVDAGTDEIHVVIRSHGPPIPGMVADQIHTIGGGCGVNVCSNAAVAIFE